MFKSAMKTFSYIKKIKKLQTSKEDDFEKTIKLLHQFLENEGGLFLKMTQVLQARGHQKKDLEDIISLKLKSRPLHIIQKQLSLLYQKPFFEIFHSIENKAFVASIAQVHQATLLISQDKVAIKVMHPNIKNKLKEQIRILNFAPILSKGVNNQKKVFPIQEYKSMFDEMIESETDFFKEIANLKKSKELNKNISYIIIPKVYDEFSRKECYIQSWHDGEILSKVCENWSSLEKTDLATKILESFFLSLFHHGFLNCDPNEGNQLYLKENSGIKVICLDFGHCYQFPENFRLALIKLIFAAINNEKISPAQFLSYIDLDEKKMDHLQSRLPTLFMILFEPFLSPAPYDLKSWNFSKKIDLLLGDEKWYFRSAGGKEFFLLMKTFLGVVKKIEKLDAKISWQKIFQKSVISLIMKVSSLPPKENKTKQMNTFYGQSKNIIIHITENKIEKIKITLPITAIEELENLIEDNIIEKLQKRKIFIPEIIQRAYKNGLTPQQLFNLKENNQEIEKIITVSIK